VDGVALGSDLQFEFFLWKDEGMPMISLSQRWDAEADVAIGVEPDVAGVGWEWIGFRHFAFFSSSQVAGFARSEWWRECIMRHHCVNVNRVSLAAAVW